MNIKKELSKGIAINFITRYSNIFIQIILGMILSRILSPKEFGIVAIVQVFVTFFTLLSDMGLGPAIIQKKLSKKDIESIFNFSVFLALFFSFLFFSSRGLISNFYNDKIYSKVVTYLSISVLFFTLSTVPLAINRKEKKFKLIGLIDLTSGFLGGVASIILAYKGNSYFAIIYGAIIKSFFQFILNFYFAKVKLTLNFTFGSVKKIFKYSFYQFLFNFVNYFSRNLDNILIGKFLGPIYLGFYDKAYKLMLYPVGNLTGVLTPIIHPVLSRHQDNKKLIFETYCKMVKLLSLIGFPLSVFLYFNSREVIEIMYGKNWDSSIPVFQALACTVGIQVILSSSGSIFQVSDKTNYLFLSGTLSAITICTAIGLGVYSGDLVKLSYYLLIAFSINFFQGYYFLIKKVLNQSLLSFLGNLKSSVLISILSFISLLVYSNFINIQNIYVNFIFKFLISLGMFLIGVLVTKEFKFLKNIKG